METIETIVQVSHELVEENGTELLAFFGVTARNTVDATGRRGSGELNVRKIGRDDPELGEHTTEKLVGYHLTIGVV